MNGPRKSVEGLDPDVYRAILDDYETLLSDPPQRQPMYESETQYLPVEFDSSQLPVETRKEFVAHGFEPVARLESASRQTHPFFAETPDDLSRSEYWSHVSGVVAVLDCERHKRHLSVIFSNGTQVAIWPALGTGSMFPNPDREVMASSGSLESDLKTIHSQIEARSEAGLRPLQVVDVQTARLYDDVHAAYLATELPTAYENLLDSAMQTARSGRRQEYIAAVACVLLAALLGFVFSSWMVFGVGLAIAGLLLWMLDRWMARMRNDVMADINLTDSLDDQV